MVEFEGQAKQFQAWNLATRMLHTAPSVVRLVRTINMPQMFLEHAMKLVQKLLGCTTFHCKLYMKSPVQDLLQKGARWLLSTRYYSRSINYTKNIYRIFARSRRDRITGLPASGSCSCHETGSTFIPSFLPLDVYWNLLPYPLSRKCFSHSVTPCRSIDTVPIQCTKGTT